MTSPFPFESWARPGKDAFEFWISFFPAAPLFGVEWRFAEMMGPMADPTMNPFMQAGQPSFMQAPFMMPFPATTPAGAAARPGELDTPARADEPQGRPVAKATAVTADAAKQATRIAAETGKAAARTAEATVNAAATTVEKRNEDKTAADRNGETPKKAGEVAGKTADAAAKAAETVAKSGVKAGSKTGNGAATVGETDKRAEKKAEARAAVPETAKTAVEAAAPAVAKSAKAEPEAVEAAIAAGPRPKGLLSKRPDDTDDLKMLKGVGPGLEKQLNDLGVWTLEQLSKMTDADLAWIDANLTSFKGRCFRDDWVGQAKSRLKK